MGNTERIAKRPEMLFHQAGVEAVVARRHGCVRSEGYFAGDARDGLIEIQALFLHAAANRFEDCKSAMPFVQMKNAGRDAHRAQSTEASHAEQQLLANS